MEYEFPKISVESITNLRLVIRDCYKNKDLLNELPYEPIINDTIKMFVDKANDNIEKKGLNDLDYESETVSLYESIQDIDNLDTIDPKEKIAIIKLRTQILQQLIDMHKESKRIKNINQFTDMVFSILTEEQKTKILEGE